MLNVSYFCADTAAAAATSPSLRNNVISFILYQIKL